MMQADPSSGPIKQRLRSGLSVLFAWGSWGQRVRTVLLSFVLLIVVGFLGFWAYGRSAVYFYHPKNMTILSGKTKTQCVGRYLIDVPVELGNFGVSPSEFTYGLDADFKTVEVGVKYDDYTQAQFVQETNSRANELKSKQNEELKIPLLLAQEVWDTPHGKALMLRYLENKFYSSSLVTSELHILIGTRYAVISGRSPDEDLIKYVGKTGRESYKFINPKPMEDRLRVIAQNIKGYQDANKAPEGFCVAGVVMNNKTMGYDVETASFGAHADKNLLPDTNFRIGMQGQYGKEDVNLLQRVARASSEIQAVLAANGGALFELRKGNNKINAIPALEYAEAAHLKSNLVVFHFFAETALPKEQQSLQRPFFEFDLEIGSAMAYKPSPLDQDQAIKVWDGMLKSMHLAPSNGGNRIDDKTGGMVPETRVGQACPKSGVWAASLPNTHPSARNLASAPQRFVNVRQGQSMPEVYAKFMFTQTADADNAAITWTWIREA